MVTLQAWRFQIRATLRAARFISPIACSEAVPWIWCVPGPTSNLDSGFDAGEADEMRAFGGIARCIIFDKRGTGISDRVQGAPSLEERMDDVRAVMDSAESSEAVILGRRDGAAMSVLFAATYPARTMGWSCETRSRASPAHLTFLGVRP